MRQPPITASWLTTGGGNSWPADGCCVPQTHTTRPDGPIALGDNNPDSQRAALMGFRCRDLLSSRHASMQVTQCLRLKQVTGAAAVAECPKEYLPTCCCHTLPPASAGTCDRDRPRDSAAGPAAVLYTSSQTHLCSTVLSLIYAPGSCYQITPYDVSMT